MKAVSPILSHSLLIAIGITASALILFTVSNLQADLEKRSAEAKLNFVTEFVKNQVIDLYLTSNQAGTPNGYVGNVSLNLPDEIINNKYKVKLQDRNISATVFIQNTPVTVSKPVNVNATFSGETYLPARLISQKTSGGIQISVVQ